MIKKIKLPDRKQLIPISNDPRSKTKIKKNSDALMTGKQ